MKNSEIRDLTTSDLNEKIATLEAEINKMTMDHTVTPLENPMQIRGKKKDIARMKTELRKRELTDKK